MVASLALLMVYQNGLAKNRPLTGLLKLSHLAAMESVLPEIPSTPSEILFHRHPSCRGETLPVGMI